MSGSVGNGAFSQIEIPGRPARLRGNGITPKPAATALASAIRLKALKVFSQLSPAWLNAFMATRPSRLSSPNDTSGTGPAGSITVDAECTQTNGSVQKYRVSCDGPVDDAQIARSVVPSRRSRSKASTFEV